MIVCIFIQSKSVSFSTHEDKHNGKCKSAKNRIGTLNYFFLVSFLKIKLNP